MLKPFYKRTWVIVVSAVLASLTIGWLVIRSQITNIIEYQLRQQLSANPNSLYVIDFEKLKLNIIQGDIKLIGAKVSPRPSAVDSLMTQGELPSLLAKVEVKEILLEGINFKKAITEQQVSIKDLRIHDPQVDLHLSGSKKKEKEDEEKKVNIEELLFALSKELHSSSLHLLDITKGEIRLYKTLEADSLLLSVSNFDVHLTDFRIDTSKNDLPLNLSAFSLHCQRIRSDANPEYTFDLEGLKLNRPDSSLSFQSFSMLPKRSREEFMSDQEFEKAQLIVSTGKVRVEGFLPLDLILKDRIYVKSVSIEKPNLSIYKDKNLPWPSHQIKEIPSKMIRNIPIPLYVPRVKVTEGNILLQLLPPEKKVLAELPLTNFYVSVFNLTNEDQRLAENPIMEVTVQGNLFDGPKLRGNLQFDMLSKNNSYTVNANLGASKMKVFNSMLSPTSGINIKEGDLLGAQVKLKGNRKRMWGTLEVEYEKAVIDIFKEDEKKGNHKLGLLSFAANTIVRSSNLKKNPTFQVGLINFERTLDFPFIRFLWFSIFEGLKDTLIGGHNNEAEVEGISSNYVTSEMKKEERLKKKRNRKPLFK